VIARLAAHSDRYFADQTAWTAHLDKLGIAALKVNPQRPAGDGLACRPCRKLHGRKRIHPVPSP
jgi:hypothetical protein